MIDQIWKRVLRNLLTKLGVAELLFGSTEGVVTVDAQRLARHILTVGLNAEKLQMPLAVNIDSDTTSALFLTGPGVKIMSGSFVTDDSSIGAYSYVGFNSLVCKAKVGRYVSIADNVSIGAGEHGLGNISTSSVFYDGAYEELTTNAVSIGHDAWIGTASVIRRGVHIGIGAVVGANSFVNRDVSPYTIVAGSPAKVIGRRFSETDSMQLLTSHWWDKSPEEARTEIARLSRLLGRGKS